MLGGAARYCHIGDKGAIVLFMHYFMSCRPNCNVR